VSSRSQAAPPFALTGGNGQLQAEGPLNFASARRARELGLDAVRAANALVIDCHGITVSDSAGLTVLLDWLAAARAQGRSLRFTHLPQGLAALGQISEVNELLERGV
jgi:phospholipid transport system transporter-binding protein